MPATETLPDLSDDQLAALSDRMKQARQARSDREHREQGRAQEKRRVRSKLQRVEAELSKLRADQDRKLQAAAKLRERLEKVEQMPEHAPGGQEERLVLVEALELANEKGAAVVCGESCPTNDPAHRLLFEAGPHGLSWRLPLTELERMVAELVQEQDRLQEQLERLS